MLTSTPRLAAAQRRSMRHAPARFTPDHQQTLADAARSTASRWGWRLHALAATPTYAHGLLSWRHDEPARSVAARLKRPMGQALARSAPADVPGRRWFSRGWDVKRVADPAHFHRLITSYLPQHANQGGQFWRFDP